MARNFASRVRELLRLGEPFSTWARWTVGGVALAVFSYGLWSHNAGYLGTGAVVLVAMVWLSWPEAQRQQQPAARPVGVNRRPRAAAPGEPEASPLQLPPRLAEQAGLGEARRSTGNLVDEMLSNGRYALLLRPEMNRHLDRDHIIRAVRHLDEAMALVPAGRVLLGPLAEQATSSSGAFDANPKMLEKFMHRIDALYLDRYVVTNLEYQQFLDAGGYEKLEYWDEEALPALLDFVDESGEPGPRFWVEGRFHVGDERRPVVGVSWYEASAYARWVGKRLPTDAEWTKAGAWPVESAPGRIAQRRYPWGESFDIRRANLWGSHSKGPVEVDEYGDGESVGGIHQLVGNVWEWSASPLAASAEPTLHVPETFKSVRGGAFDTYFENHATCHYQSGEHPLARRHNIGFRLALPMSTLEVAEDDESSNDGAQQPAKKSQIQEACAAVV
ncbi:MAG: formylglycine-generating enzyme family protein [Pirellulales bacterium]